MPGGPADTESDGMRLFFAIPLPETLQNELAAFQARNREAEGAASWPDPRALHLTLAFLGEQEPTRVPGLLVTAGSAVAGHGPFELTTSGLGGFPRDGSARVLWLGLEAQPRLSALALALRGGLAAAGIVFDNKPFKAHLTLARFRIARSITRFGTPPGPIAFTAGEVVLYQSLPLHGGHRYLPLGRVTLVPECG